MTGSKQIGIPPAAANRPHASTSHARGRGTNSSKQIDESRGEWIGREGKESNLISSYSYCFMRWMTSTIHIIRPYHSAGNSSRKQAGEFDKKIALALDAPGERKTG